jgi:anti-sigma factor RsiW
LNCREFVDFLMAYLDDALPTGQRRVFESHLGECPSCVTYLDTYRETVRLGRRLCSDPEGQVPDDVPEPLLRAILAARGRQA